MTDFTNVLNTIQDKMLDLLNDEEMSDEAFADLMESYLEACKSVTENLNYYVQHKELEAPPFVFENTIQVAHIRNIAELVGRKTTSNDDFTL